MISPPVMGPVLINNMLRFHFLRIQETQFLEYSQANRLFKKLHYLCKNITLFGNSYELIKTPPINLFKNIF